MRPKTGVPSQCDMLSSIDRIHVSAWSLPPQQQGCRAWIHGATASCVSCCWPAETQCRPSHHHRLCNAGRLITIASATDHADQAGETPLDRAHHAPTCREPLAGTRIGARMRAISGSERTGVAPRFRRHCCHTRGCGCGVMQRAALCCKDRIAHSPAQNRTTVKLSGTIRTAWPGAQPRRQRATWNKHRPTAMTGGLRFVARCA
jgi:hypothetical protein